MAAKKEIKGYRVIVTPTDARDYNENYAVSGVKRIPFSREVVISAHDLRQIKQQKSPIQVTEQINVREIMDSMSISQEKANRVARQMQSEPDMNKKFRYVPKYNVEILKEIPA